MRKNLLKVIATLMLSTLVISACSMVCFAQGDSLNEIGGYKAVENFQVAEPTEVARPVNSPQQVPSDVNLFDDSKVSESNRSSADAVGEIFKQGGLTEESVEKSKKWVEPIAKIINLLVAIVTSLLALGILCISVLDLVYIQLPFTRSFLAPTQSSPTAPMQGQMGMQGQGQMGSPMGNHTQAPAPTPAQGSNSSKQWVSDEAVASLSEVQSQQGRPGGKNALLSYAKKRSFSLIMLGICVVLFTCTVFTDLGVMIGMKLIALASGISL